MNSSDQNGIRIVAINGSARPGNYTGKALNLVVDELRQQHVTVELMESGKLRLPFPGSDPASEDAARLRMQVKQATGIVLATPEYHGSFSSAMKLVIENLGFPSALAGKPIAFLGVAGGAIGAVKAIEHLHSVCSHVGAIILPGPISVANVQKYFDESGRCLDERVEKRVRSVATNLMDYIKGYICPKVALEQLVREGAVAL
ncbi:MAG TPA: NAD(P)H-dependent oxidoreductase [bacterium]